MRTKIYNSLFYSAQKLKRRLGIDNWEAFKKKKKRNVLSLFYRKKFNSVDLIQVMKNMGMDKGSVVFIHSSMTEFYNYEGTAKEFIDKILVEIGVNGTLLMPAYPKVNEKFDEEVDFDVLQSPSAAGYLTETFRKYPGVKRSINLQHSVCAYGKLADYFTRDHHKSLTAWDEYSPYYRMSQLDNTLVFSLGLPKMLGTMIHCVESVLRSKYKYFQQFFTKKITYKYRNESGDIFEHNFLTHEFARRTDKSKIIKNYFSKEQIKYSQLSNLTVKMVKAKYTLDLLIELAEKGITLYTIPSKARYVDEQGKFLKIENSN